MTGDLMTAKESITDSSNSSESRDCSTGNIIDWSEEKVAECCLVIGLGCPAGASTKLATTISVSYDCTEGALHWRREWSSFKKRWCCKKFSLGCDVLTTAGPALRIYDCKKGSDDQSMG